MSNFEHFFHADDLAKGGAVMDGGAMAQIRAGPVPQTREEVHAALQYAASFHFKNTKAVKKSNTFCCTRCVML